MTDNEQAPALLTDDEITDIEETITVEKTKKPFKMTEARKKALEKGRETRAKKVAEKKVLKNEEKELNKLNNQRQKAMKILGMSEDDMVREEKKKQPAPKKKKAKPKIVYESESESEESESESSDDEPPTVERRRRHAYTDSQVRAIMEETDRKAKELIERKPLRLKRV